MKKRPCLAHLKNIIIVQLLGQWLWLSLYGSRFWNQRSAVRIQSWALLFTINCIESVLKKRQYSSTTTHLAIRNRQLKECKLILGAMWIVSVVADIVRMGMETSQTWAAWIRYLLTFHQSTVPETTKNWRKAIICFSEVCLI